MKVSFAVAVMAAAALSACAHKDSADDDLAKDLAMASSSDGIALAPAAPSRATVSAVEQVAPAPPRVASSTRSTAPRRARRPARSTAQAAPAPDPDPVEEAAPAEESAEEPVTIAARPQPIPASEPSTAGTGPIGNDGPGASRGPSTGEVIGAIIGAVIRGGTVGEDHCDPRVDGRRPRISINSRVPVIVRAF